MLIAGVHFFQHDATIVSVVGRQEVTSPPHPHYESCGGMGSAGTGAGTTPDGVQRLDVVKVQEDGPGMERAPVQTRFCKAGRVKQA